MHAKRGRRQSQTLTRSILHGIHQPPQRWQATTAAFQILEPQASLNHARGASLPLPKGGDFATCVRSTLTSRQTMAKVAAQALKARSAPPLRRTKRNHAPPPATERAPLQQSATRPLDWRSRWRRQLLQTGDAASETRSAALDQSTKSRRRLERLAGSACL